MHTIKRKLASDGGFFTGPGAKNITTSQWHVLLMVEKNKDISVKKIASLIGITSSAVTQLINELVKKDYIIRKGKPEDRRSLSIALSNKSKEQIHAIKRQGLNKLIALFDILSDNELKTYCDLNKKIADKILNK
jgi:DNA-binding MarR family transcriptional regulator